MSRAVVNVATDRFLAGQARLQEAVTEHGGGSLPPLQFLFRDDAPLGGLGWPTGCPRHHEKPFAFKAFALHHVAQAGYTSLLWCDSSILPIRSLEPLWERIERDGYWFANNAGWSNYQWTADSAYPDLFSEVHRANVDADPISAARVINRAIPHVVATAFGLSTAHPKGRKFMDEFYRLASKTQAFCGPWLNRTKYHDNPYQAPCGPPDVLGHRHDQTCASVLAWRLGFKLTEQPDVYAVKGAETERTILMADGSVNV